MLLLVTAYAAPLDPTAMLGTFTLAEPVPTAQARIDAAIDTSVASLPWAFRGIARSRMSDMDWCRTWKLASDGTTLTITCAQHPHPVTVDLATGRGTTKNKEGESVPVTATAGPGELVVTLKGEQGSSQRTYRRTDGRVSVRIVATSDRLPEPLAYDVHYASAR